LSIAVPDSRNLNHTVKNWFNPLAATPKDEHKLTPRTLYHTAPILAQKVPIIFGSYSEGGKGRCAQIRALKKLPILENSVHTHRKGIVYLNETTFFLFTSQKK
jgi:hypothetical protein